MNDLTGLRWLASSVASAVAPEVPAPVLVSRHLTGAIPEYVCWWILNADPSGRFAAKTRWLRSLPSALLIRLLLLLGYDGLVFRNEEAIVGHVFFQRRGAAVHGFSTGVSEALDGRGYSVVMMLDYVAYASSIPGVEKARVGTGHNTVTRRLLERLKRHEERLGWQVTLDGWVAFRADQPVVETQIGNRPRSAGSAVDSSR